MHTARSDNPQAGQVPDTSPALSEEKSSRCRDAQVHTSRNHPLKDADPEGSAPHLMSLLRDSFLEGSIIEVEGRQCQRPPTPPAP